MSGKSSKQGQHQRGFERPVDAFHDEGSDIDNYAKAGNVSSRRLLIRAIRESLHSMEEREASQLNKWTEEMKILTRKNELASNAIINERRCIICHDREKSVILMPCRHLCLCLECSNNTAVEICPKCRGIICNKIEVYV